MRKVYVLSERRFQKGHALRHHKGTTGLAYLNMFAHSAPLNAHSSGVTRRWCSVRRCLCVRLNRHGYLQTLKPQRVAEHKDTGKRHRRSGEDRRK
ncbi:hypothetical protein D3C80_1992420 [compost metagenome]